MKMPAEYELIFSNLQVLIKALLLLFILIAPPFQAERSNKNVR